MAQKNRNDITNSISSNIYQNTNKEITATMLREVLTDIKDSFFNNLSDELRSKKYNNSQSLEEYLGNLIGKPTLWGSTDWFDPSSANGNIEEYEDNGIVSSISYSNPNNERSFLIINFSKDISDRKIDVNLFTDNFSSTQLESNYCAPVIANFSFNQIRVGLREIGGYNGKIRIEVMAHSVVKG